LVFYVVKEFAYKQARDITAHMFYVLVLYLLLTLLYHTCKKYHS